LRGRGIVDSARGDVYERQVTSESADHSPERMDAPVAQAADVGSGIVHLVSALQPHAISRGTRGTCAYSKHERVSVWFTMSMHHLHAVWLDNSIVLKNAKKAIRAAVKELREQKVEFDTVAFCGMSGALFAPILAHKMGKEMILVRKPSTKESRHSSHDTEGYTAAYRVLIVDDICSSGKTVEYIIESVKSHCCQGVNGNKPVQFAGTYFYGEGRGCGDSPRGFVKNINMFSFKLEIASEDTCVSPSNS